MKVFQESRLFNYSGCWLLPILTQDIQRRLPIHGRFLSVSWFCFPGSIAGIAFHTCTIHPRPKLSITNGQTNTCQTLDQKIFKRQTLLCQTGHFSAPHCVWPSGQSVSPWQWQQCAGGLCSDRQTHLSLQSGWGRYELTPSADHRQICEQVLWRFSSGGGSLLLLGNWESPFQQPAKSAWTKEVPWGPRTFFYRFYKLKHVKLFLSVNKC